MAYNAAPTLSRGRASYGNISVPHLLFCRSGNDGVVDSVYSRWCIVVVVVVVGVVVRRGVSVEGVLLPAIYALMVVVHLSWSSRRPAGFKAQCVCN